uniref:Uncharacterized protein n=1 Tax=Anopheles albimanus TaxID=7167 RepID=A0A182FVP1_ANOAL
MSLDYDLDALSYFVPRNVVDLSVSRAYGELLLDVHPFRDLQHLRINNSSSSAVVITEPTASLAVSIEGVVMRHLVLAKSSLTYLLSIKQTQLNHIPKSLAGQQGLRQLTIEGSGLQYFNLDSISGLLNLTHVSLTLNQIVTVNGTIGKRTSARLAVLDLSDNEIVNFNFGFVALFRHLEQISCRENLIERLRNSLNCAATHSYKCFASLRVLNFDNNEIASIPRGLFRSMTALDELMLRYNFLQRFSAFEIGLPPRLKLLDLGVNSIALINLKALKQLKVLILDYNELIEQNIGGMLPKSLEELNVEYNFKINCSLLKELPTVRQLEMSDAKLLC